MSLDNETVKKLFEKIPPIDNLIDKKAEDETLKCFMKIEKENEAELMFNFIENVIKEKVLGVRIRSGLLYWCVSFFGCKKGDFKNPNKRDSNSISYTFQFLNQIKEIYLSKVNEGSSKQIETKIKESLNIFYHSENFSSIRMVILKIYAFLFREYLLPIFSEDHIFEFLQIFHPKLNREDFNLNKINYFFDLKSSCDKFLSLPKIDPEKRDQSYVHFLYYQGKFLQKNNKNLIPVLKRLGFFGYPLDESAVVGLFYRIINIKKLPSKLQKFYQFRTYLLKETYPDLIGKFSQDDQWITIEFEYLASKYSDHFKEKKKADYIICWENDLSKTNPKYPEIIALKEEILSIME